MTECLRMFAEMAAPTTTELISLVAVIALTGLVVYAMWKSGWNAI